MRVDRWDSTRSVAASPPRSLLWPPPSSPDGARGAPARTPLRTSPAGTRHRAIGGGRPRSAIGVRYPHRRRGNGVDLIPVYKAMIARHVDAIVSDGYQPPLKPILTQVRKAGILLVSSGDDIAAGARCLGELGRRTSHMPRRSPTRSRRRFTAPATTRSSRSRTSTPSPPRGRRTWWRTCARRTRT